jgi:hypothetical protein
MKALENWFIPEKIQSNDGHFEILGVGVEFRLPPYHYPFGGNLSLCNIIVTALVHIYCILLYLSKVLGKGGGGGGGVQ